MQSLFARHAALASVGGALSASRDARCSVLTSPFRAFEEGFNGLWADNADALSFLYAGTGALKTDFTRLGKRTITGALADGVNSVMRFVLNNLSDGRTQDAWDLFTGRFVPRRVDVGELRDTSFVRPGAGGVAKARAAAIVASPAKIHLAGVTPVSGLLLSIVVSN